MARRLCSGCRADITGRHPNAKRCRPCARARVARPVPSLPSDVQRQILRLAGQIPRKELAERLGLSIPTLQRFARRHGLSLRRPRYDEATIEAVIACYSEHGKEGVEEAFPHVRWRSIIEHIAKRREDFQPRQTRWRDDEILMAAQMAGLVPMDVQAAFFNRPRAHAGSIKAFWRKRMGQQGTQLHGLRWNHAKRILQPEVPFVDVKWTTVAPSAQRCRDIRRRLVLWCDMAPYLRPEMPPFVAEGIAAMADFQRWLFQTPNPRAEIERILAVVG